MASWRHQSFTHLVSSRVRPRPRYVFPGEGLRARRLANIPEYHLYWDVPIGKSNDSLPRFSRLGYSNTRICMDKTVSSEDWQYFHENPIVSMIPDPPFSVEQYILRKGTHAVVWHCLESPHMQIDGMRHADVELLMQNSFPKFCDIVLSVLKETPHMRDFGIQLQSHFEGLSTETLADSLTSPVGTQGQELLNSVDSQVKRRKDMVRQLNDLLRRPDVPDSTRDNLTAQLRDAKQMLKAATALKLDLMEGISRSGASEGTEKTGAKDPIKGKTEAEDEKKGKSTSFETLFIQSRGPEIFDYTERLPCTERDRGRLARGLTCPPSAEMWEKIGHVGIVEKWRQKRTPMSMLHPEIYKDLLHKKDVLATKIEVGSTYRSGRARFYYGRKSPFMNGMAFATLVGEDAKIGESVDNFTNHHRFEILWGEDDLGVRDLGVFVISIELWMARPSFGYATSLESRYGRFLAHEKYRRILKRVMEKFVQEFPWASCPIAGLSRKMNWWEANVQEAKKGKKQNAYPKQDKKGRKGKKVKSEEGV